MFYGDPITELQLVHQRQAEFRRQAELARLVRDARGTQPTRTDRLLSILGEVLIQLGLRLRAGRVEPLVPPTAPGEATVTRRSGSPRRPLPLGIRYTWRLATKFASRAGARPCGRPDI